MRGKGVLVLVGVGLALASAAAASRSPLGLKARVFQPGEFPGWVVNERQLFRKPQGWASLLRADAATTEFWTARLRREGFVAAFREHLWSPGLYAGDAQSWVAQFRSPTAARAEVETFLELDVRTHQKRKPFPVPGVPGAHGYRLTNPQGWGDNILFADGVFVYLVGDGAEKGAVSPPPRAALLAAARRLHGRVHGR